MFEFILGETDLDEVKRGNRIQIRTYPAFQTNSERIIDIPIPHQWPVDCRVMVWPEQINITLLNTTTCTIDEVADISKYIHTGSNKLKFGYKFTTPFYVVVQIVKPLTVDQLVSRLQSKLESIEYSKERIRIMFNNDINTFKFSLCDPLVKTVIKIPSRFLTCKHIQCFDLDNYLRMNEQIRRWNCPICGLKSSFQFLVIDSFFLSIMNGIPNDQTTIEISQNLEYKITK